LCRQYADIDQVMTEAVTNWMEDVKNGNYPSANESYGLPKDVDTESFKDKSFLIYGNYQSPRANGILDAQIAPRK
jgi:hypothetical protein